MENIKQKFITLFEEYSKGNFEQDDLYNTEAFTNHCKIRISIGEKKFFNYGEYKRGLEDIRKGFPDFRYEIEDVIYDNETKVIVKGKKIGTYKNPMGFKKPTNEVIEMEFVHIYGLNKDNKKIETLWSIQDELTLFLGIGFVKYDMGTNNSESTTSQESTFPIKAAEITKEWMQKILLDAKVIPSDVNVEEVIVDNNVGENQQGYVGTTLRLILKYSKEVDEKVPKQFIAKLASENLIMRSYFHSMKVYEREISIYKFFNKDNFPVPLAKCYFSDINKSNGENILLLEDLKERGFEVGDTVVGITMESAKKILVYLSQLHSFFWENLDKNLEWIDVPLRELNKTNSTKAYQLNLQKFVQFHTKTVPEKLMEKIKNFSLEKYLVVNHQREHHKTLLHGDTHVNNILFGKEETIFVDWQIINFDICTRDFAYFLILSCTPEFTNQHYEEIKSFYYENLIKNAKEGSNLKNYTRELFEQDVLTAISMVTFNAVLLSANYNPEDKVDENNKVQVRGNLLMANCLKRYVNLTEKVGIDKILNL